MITNNPVQQNEFRVLGMSRSGNHGIINWLIHQLQGNYLFLNCPEPKYNPYSTSRPLNNKGTTYTTNIPSFSLQEEQKGKFSKKDYLIYNHEDSFLGSFNTTEQKKKRETWVGSSEIQKDLLILRDPFNLFASRMKAGFIRGHSTHHGARPISTLILRRMYKQHAREFLGERKNLENKILVNFNLWSSNKSYRQNLAHQLGIDFEDKGFTEVPAVAGGSSFDGTTFSGSSHKMRLQDRWKEFTNEKEYWSLFDDEMMDLSEQIFGRIEPMHVYRQKREKAESILQ